MSDEDTKSKAEEAYALARQFELDYGGCPQCVLMAIQDTVGGVDDATIKAAHGLSGGGGLTGVGTCGALAGGLVALSVRYGRSTDDMGGRARFLVNFKKGQELVARFREKFGGITCKEVQTQFVGKNYDMWTEEGYKAFKEECVDKCANASGSVAQWVVEMIG